MALMTDTHHTQARRAADGIAADLAADTAANTATHTATHAPHALPRIAVLATGGTIAGAAGNAMQTAGYQAGALSVERLLEAVPALAGLAQIQAEQLASIDSKDLSTALWSTLSARLQVLLASDQIDGVVITHGTDTLEETAFLLHLTVKSHKPVVLTAAMRPATALSADGPLNLCQAVTVAADPQAAGRGVLVVLNNQIHGAREVSKRHSAAVQAFESPEFGALGWVQDQRVEFQRVLTRPHTLATPFAAPAVWPDVALVVSYAGVTRVAVDALVGAGVQGLVVAGTGNGSIHATLQQALADAVARGVPVVRTSRTGAGHVMRNGAAPDDALGFVAGGTLSPFKARILLMLALAGSEGRVPTSDQLQNLFDTY